MNRERTPPEGFKNLFGPQAAKYTAARPRYPRPLFHYLAVASGDTRLAWDCATGNGQAAVGLAERFARVVATDASAEMIGSAIPHPRVSYHVTKYGTGLPDGSVNLVTVAQALHWLDVDAFVAEARRVLAPGGVLAAWCYKLCRVEPAIDEVVDQFYEGPLGTFWPPERDHIANEYRSIPLPIDEMVPPVIEMSEDWTLPEFLAFLRTWSAVSRFIAERGDGAVVAFEEALRTRWGMPMLRRMVTWPVHFRIGRLQ